MKSMKSAEKVDKTHAGAKGKPPAWVAGGSSSRPRAGKPFKGKWKKKVGQRGAQSSTKRGAQLMMNRSSKTPSGRGGPYTPKHQKPTDPMDKFRNAVRDAADRTEVEFETLMNMSGKKKVEKLWKWGHLHKHQYCPFCNKGKIGALRQRSKGGQWMRRCKRKGCQKWIHPGKGSPVFKASKGKSTTTIDQQAAILWCAAWNVQQGMAPAIIKGVKSKACQKVYRDYHWTVAQYVVGNQDKIKFGDERLFDNQTDELDELETDEAVFRKTDVGKNVVEFQEAVGSKRRGDRKSLVLEWRAPKSSRSTRAANGRACPPPYTKAEWKPFSKKHGIGANTLNHTDGAPVYKNTRQGGAHDSVNHGKGRQFVKKTVHKDKKGKIIKSYGGTQSLDGWWATAKKNIVGTNARFKDKVSNKVRFAQFLHWLGGRDRFLEAGKVLSWVPESV